MLALWHAARGLAHAGERSLADASKELAEVASLKDADSLKALYVSNVNAASSLVAIAHEVLAGEIATREWRADVATKHFATAVRLEDALIYMEPPDWPIPVRQLQGAALLEIGRLKGAETAFRGDLRKFPDNGWSLSGLAASLERQGRASEAAKAKARLADQWRRADTQLVAARPK